MKTKAKCCDSSQLDAESKSEWVNVCISYQLVGDFVLLMGDAVVRTGYLQFTFYELSVHFHQSGVWALMIFQARKGFQYVTEFTSW